MIDPNESLQIDPWASLRGITRARIGLGRCGDSLPTSEQLDFRLSHAMARDAVHCSADLALLAQALSPLASIRVKSAAPDRATYLRRPDLGRRLSDESRECLLALPESSSELCFVIADGLSSAAVQNHAVRVVEETVRLLPQLQLAPVVLAEQARVAIGDEIGEILKAQLVALFIGERPGLSSPDSLGIYLTWNPRVGKQDSERNCISNIHAAGLSYANAAQKLTQLIQAARALRASGVSLKAPDERPAL